MQRKYMPISKSDSPFITKLYEEINKTIDIQTNANAYKRANKLIEYKFQSKMPRYSDLPPMALFGTIHIIKNNSIIKFYITYKISSSIMSDYKSDPHFVGMVYIINLNMEDVENFPNSSAFDGMGDMIEYRRKVVFDFMLSLLHGGFKAYYRHK